MLVSVIMPSYNTEKYIGESIESILNQTFTDFELIIIDDCSTDNTWNIIKKYQKIDTRIISIRNKNNLGITVNRNKGLQLAQGKYIVWHDSDDIAIPTRIEKQFAFMEKNKKVGIVGGFLQSVDENGNLKSVRLYADNDKLLREKIFRYSPVSQGAAMIRKECYKKIGNYNTFYKVAEDLEMSFRIGTIYEFANLQEILIKYRARPGSSTYTNLKMIELNSIKIRKIFSKNNAYNYTRIDKIYNFLHYLSIFLIPSIFKIWLFDKLRNTLK